MVVNAGLPPGILMLGTDRYPMQAYRRARIADRTFVLEEFIAGDEWVADGFVFDGKVEFCSIGTYSDPCLAAVDHRRVHVQRVCRPAGRGSR